MKQLSGAIWQQSTYIPAICSGREQIKQTLDKGSASLCRNLQIQPEILYVPGLLGKHFFLKTYPDNSLTLNNPKACWAAFNSLVCLAKVSLLSLHSVDGCYREMRKWEKKKKQRKKMGWERYLCQLALSFPRNKEAAAFQEQQHPKSFLVLLCPSKSCNCL